MLSPKYFIYLAVGNGMEPRMDLSSNPRIDALLLEENDYERMYLLKPPQPLWIMERILQEMLRDVKGIKPSHFFKRASGLLKEFFPGICFRGDSFLMADLKGGQIEFVGMESLLWGRSLLLTEIPELLRSFGQSLPWDLEDWMQYLYFERKVQREAAVSIDKLGLPYCRRCGSTANIIEDNCLFCGNTRCLTCANCQSMGLAKSCIPLYSAAYPNWSDFPGGVQPVLGFDLTPPQSRASRELEYFWETGSGEFLVWAVCGAGKTEVSFSIIARALNEKARVLIAIPRKDVVQELLPRFEKTFPGLPVAGLYGGSEVRFADAPLTIATTHQCLRLYRCFELIVLDEGDAFPYRESSMLHFAVRRALKPGGRLVIMTATPDSLLIAKVTSGTIPFVTIPARPHRKPLILPEMVKLDLRLPVDPDSKWEPPDLIKRFLLDIKASGRKGLVFLPTVKVINQLGDPLLRWAGNNGIKGGLIHSRINDRERLKKELVNGAKDFLVASTVLERGVTIPNLDVLVLQADNEMVFDSRTLVQIAGRTGRLGEPARVIFAAKNFSKAMRDCCQWIKKMNDEGYHLGYLD